MKYAITPTRSENFPEWYQQVVMQAELAENSPVRGCMVIRPWGYGIWESIQRELDRKFKETGHLNAYFPLLIPLSFLQQEADHVEGFAKECAVVTHHRLEQTAAGQLSPAGELEEPLIIRPTSETVIGASFAKWVQSYRDLPLLINQWANVMRWEMRPRIFLRTSEFLWQEGHTAHAFAQEAREETRRMLDIYERFAAEYLAIPVIKGEKCSWEKFPGAVNTYTIEAMMQDGKALQAGTSHFLGQNFAKASNIQFLNQQGEKEFAWTTSWGVSTRLLGGLIMTHSDDDGLVLPPLVAPVQIIIIPIIHRVADTEAVLAHCKALKSKLSRRRVRGEPVRVDIDSREINGGEKKWYHIKRGVPVRVEIGTREIAKASVSISRRDSSREIIEMSTEAFVKGISQTLLNIQATLLNHASLRLAAHTKTVQSLAAFKEAFEGRDGTHGFVMAPFVDDIRVESALKELSVTVRCLPLTQPKAAAICLFTGQETRTWALYAKAY